VADPLITRAQLENRLGKVTVQRLADDNNDGVADKSVVDQLLEDATSKVRGALGPWYDSATTTAENATTATELRRIALDAAVAMAAERRPTIIKLDWVEKMKQVDRDLARIANGRANLGADPPPAQRNQRARVISSSRGGRGWDC
jgi:phage gp36-like protein